MIRLLTIPLDTLCLRAIASLAFVVAAAGSTPAQTADKLEFNRHIRPILSENCFVCHGPDSASRQADLRLDLRGQATADRGGYRAIVPGDAAASELVRRITSTDPDERMPPAKSALKLTPPQIETLRRWIAEGAAYQPHWSFIAPRRPEPPEVKHSEGIVNPIDRFVRARLEQEGLVPAPQADAATLLRRVTFDLTGLPPTPQELTAFEQAAARDFSAAYEAAVDRLLASPRYGERMASVWLDAARYADTNGYQSDGPRFMWRWRDWVIEAFNRNQPFDQFTIEQLAGDLLPEPTREQLIATGFNRNHRGNSEGGIIPEEYLAEYAVDRVDTTATVWLGLTIGCARCHDHKYDPISQREFYQLFAFFNGVPELGKVTRDGNSVPLIKAPTRDQERQLAELENQAAAAERAWLAARPKLEKAQAAWELALVRGKGPEYGDERDRGKETSDDWSIREGLIVHLDFDGRLLESVKNVDAKLSDGDAAFATGPRGKDGQAIALDGQRHVEVGDVADFAETQKFSIAAWIRPAARQAMSIVSRMDEENSFLGYDLHYNAGKIQANLVNRILDDAIRVETEQTFDPGVWRHVLVTYDGSKVAAGVRIYIDGQLQPLKVINDNLSNPIRAKQPLRVGVRDTSLPFIGDIDEVRLYQRELTPSDAAVLACFDPLRHIAGLPREERSEIQSQKIAAYFLAQRCPGDLRKLLKGRDAARERRDEFLATLPTTMIMQDRPGPREAHVLVRGQYDKPGEKVAAAVPASLPPLAADAPHNRLGLARWLVDPNHPLTARVTVNRFWQMYFGTGLVKTAEDFGSQGEAPSHPELLDWLATEFVESGWDVKRLQKLIVTSATYRQSSRAAPALWQRDPENRLLARGPRFRLPAEMLRDAALATSGLLVERIGGPSVKPYQPAGLWEELTASASGATGTYVPDRGEGLYRRSLYTYWKRTVPPPAMMTFDAAGREMCVVRGSRTNTPLQALNLMNDVTYVEAARQLAQRAMLETIHQQSSLHGGKGDAAKAATEQIRHIFRLASGRWPREMELDVLEKSFARQQARFRSQPELAEKLLSVGESPRDEKLPPSGLAALTTVASIVLNLDETITKE